MLFWVFFGAVSIATVLTLVVLLLKKKFGLFLTRLRNVRLCLGRRRDPSWQAGLSLGQSFYGIEKMRRSRERFAADR
jgi:hypothetical protein